MTLFQYAILWHPTKKQIEDGEKSKLIHPITDILAADVNQVNMLAAMSIPLEYKEQLEQIQIAVRPF
jgi:hypothetical protein